MLFNKDIEIPKDYDNIVNDTVVRNTVVFDFDTNTFPIVDGSPVVVTDMDSLAEFIKNLIHVKAGTRAIYDDDYGAGWTELIGKRHKDGFEMSQFYQRIEASAKKCEAVDTVEEFKYENGKVSFRIRLKSGDFLSQSINLGGEV